MAAALVPETMSAWQYASRTGGAEGLTLVHDRPVPRIASDELLVRVRAVALNPVDWKIQAGKVPMLPRRYPAVPGFDIAGEVVELGQGVTKFKLGDPVFGGTAFTSMGGLAQFAVLKQGCTALRPQAVSAATAAALPVAGLTALQALRDHGGLPLPKDASSAFPGGYSGRVLVANASGGVGHLCVQLAKMAGAHVTATVGARNAQMVKQLGVEEALDYKTEAGQRLSVSPSPSPAELYQVVVDGTHGLPAAAVDKVLASPGVWAHLTPPASLIPLCMWRALPFQKKRVVPVMMTARTSDLEVLAKMVEEGKLKVLVEAVVPFSKAQEAWTKSLEGHVVGKVVVKMEEDGT